MKIARLLLGAFASLLILSSVPSYAQMPITLTNANTTLSASAFTVDTLGFSGFTNPTTGAGQTWNYASGTVRAHYAERFYASSDPAFSSSAVYDTIGFESLVSQGNTAYGILYHHVYDVGASGITNPGITLSAQAYNIGAITGNMSDSLWVLSQDAIYNTSIDYLALPATMDSNWSTSKARRSVNMQVKIYILSLLGYPRITNFTRVSYLSTFDSIVGWGNLSLPSVNSTPALLVKVKTLQTDSFYLNNAVPDSSLLRQFGLAQNTLTAKYSYEFFAQGSILPLFAVDYSGGNYTTPTHYYSYQTASAAVTPGGANADGIHLFPNPSHSRAFFIQLDRALGPGDRIQIADLSGNRIEAAQTSTAVNGTVVSVSLPAETAAGTYFIRVIRASGAPEQSKIEIAP